jgi:hypothetical protein
MHQQRQFLQQQQQHQQQQLMLQMQMQQPRQQQKVTVPKKRRPALQPMQRNPDGSYPFPVCHVHGINRVRTASGTSADSLRVLIRSALKISVKRGVTPPPIDIKRAKISQISSVLNELGCACWHSYYRTPHSRWLRKNSAFKNNPVAQSFVDAAERHERAQQQQVEQAQQAAPVLAPPPQRANKIARATRKRSRRSALSGSDDDSCDDDNDDDDDSAIDDDVDDEQRRHRHNRRRRERRRSSYRARSLGVRADSHASANDDDDDDEDYRDGGDDESLSRFRQPSANDGVDEVDTDDDVEYAALSLCAPRQQHVDSAAPSSFERIVTVMPSASTPTMLGQSAKRQRVPQRGSLMPVLAPFALPPSFVSPAGALRMPPPKFTTATVLRVDGRPLPSGPSMSPMPIQSPTFFALPSSPPTSTTSMQMNRFRPSSSSSSSASSPPSSLAVPLPPPPSLLRPASAAAWTSSAPSSLLSASMPTRTHSRPWSSLSF